MAVSKSVGTAGEGGGIFCDTKIWDNEVWLHRLLGFCNNFKKNSTYCALRILGQMMQLCVCDSPEKPFRRRAVPAKINGAFESKEGSFFLNSGGTNKKNTEPT